SKDPVRITVGKRLSEQNRGQFLAVFGPHPFAIATLSAANELYSPLPGVSLRTAPVVAQVNEDSPAREVLQKEDTIEGIADARGQTQHLTSARAFYEAMARRRPGDKVALQVRGRGRVAVVVGQGSDDRKPLFSLFVSAARPAQADWVGWTPVGPYDASSR